MVNAVAQMSAVQHGAVLVCRPRRLAVMIAQFWYVATSEMDRALGFLGRAFVVLGCTTATLTCVFCFGAWVFNPTTTLVILCGLATAVVGVYFLSWQDS